MSGKLPSSPILWLAALQEVIYLLLLWLYDWNARIPLFMILFFSGFFLYGATIFFLTREQHPSNVFILTSALIFRLTIFFTPPTLSEDFYRYLWDGRVQAAGYSPYDYPPKADQLFFLRDSSYEKINHKEVKTPYPPAAENLFHFFVRILPGYYGFKFGILVFDILLMEALRRLLKKEGLSLGWLILYSWHPLPILEFAGSGHMDVIGIALLVSSLVLVSQLPLASGVLIGAAILTKLAPALSLPWLLQRKRLVPVMIGLTGITALMLWQFYTPDLRMVDGVRLFYKKWWFNDSLFGILYKLTGGAEPARLTGGVCVLLCLLFCRIRGYDLYRSFVIVYGTVILFAPVVHPWYLCWLIPFLIFYRHPVWFAFTGWIVLAYWIRYIFPDGKWKPVLWLKLLIYVPLYASLMGWWLKKKLVPSARSSVRNWRDGMVE